MPKTRKKPDHASLLHALLEQLGGRLAPGTEFSGELVDGDLVAEVHVSIRPRTTPDLLSQYHALALARLQDEPYRIRHCECRANKGGGRFSQRPEGWCQRGVVAAVVIQGVFSTSPPIFRFICGGHRKSHGVAPTDVLGIVELSKSDLAPIHRLIEARDAAAREAWRAEQAAAQRAEDEAQKERRDTERAAEADGRLARLPTVPPSRPVRG